MGGKAFELAGDKILGNDAACATVDHHQILHLVAGVELDGAGFHLTAQRAVGAQQQLLAGLALGIERAADLSAAERTVGQRAAIFACKRNALSHTLVDDAVRHLGKAIDVSLARTIVAALDRVVEKTIDRVAVVLIVLGGVDATLGGNRVRTARRVLNAEVEHSETHLAKRCGSRRARKARADYDDVQLSFVGRIDQFLMVFIVCPLLIYRTSRNLRIQFHIVLMFLDF